MTVKLFFELVDGETDELVVSGSLEEIQSRAIIEKENRGALDAWSQVIEE